MDQQRPEMTVREAGRKGGKATVAKYGREHLRRILWGARRAKKGAETPTKVMPSDDNQDRRSPAT
jgi:hypothetical protein